MAENGGSKFGYFLAGLGLGAVIALLFAPRSGEETREYLRERAEEGVDTLKRRARELKERAGELAEKGKEFAERQRGSERDVTNRRSESAQPRRAPQPR